MEDKITWEAEKEALLSELEDMKLLYETIAEHSSLVENELEEKNQKISVLLNQLKKYLSPQLFQSIVGGKSEVSLSYKRKFLTIFFSDIVGFTEISDRTDPEILSELLNGYLNEMAIIAQQFGGTIDKFIGDALMVFFGDPEYIDDERHAIDCCSMALAMQTKIKELDKFWKKRGVKGLSVRMGIHSGYCTVGNFGSENRMDYTIIGGNVNIASRLESIAQSDSIYISSVTKNLLPNSFLTEFQQEFKVKGIHYPIEVFQLKDKLDIEPGNSADPNPFFKETHNGFNFAASICDSDLKDPLMRKHILQALERVSRWAEENS